MDSNEAASLIASVRMFFEMENEAAIASLRQEIAKQAEEISLRKLREEQLEKKIQQLKSRHELRQSDLELKVREAERCAEEKFKRYKMDTEQTLTKYKEEIDELQFRIESILEEITENNKSVQDMRKSKENLKGRYLDNVNLELPRDTQWRQEDMKLELERIREERIIEKVQLSKHSRKTELFVRLAEEREAQLQEKEQQIVVLSGISEKVYQNAGIFINEFVETQLQNLRVSLENMNAYKQKIIYLENQRYQDTEGSRKDQVAWHVKENNWEKQQLQYTRKINQLEIELKQEQMKREISLKQNQQLLANVLQRLEATNRVAEKRAKNSSLVLENQVNQLTGYYQTLLDNWKVTVEQIKLEQQGEQVGQQCGQQINNCDSVMKTLERENTQMRLINVSLVDQVKQLSLEQEEIKKLNEDINGQMKELFSELEEVKIYNIRHKNELDRKQQEMEMKNRNNQENGVEISCNSKGRYNLNGIGEGNQRKGQMECVDRGRNDTLEKYYNEGKDEFGLTKTITKDTSNTTLKLKSVNQQKYQEQSSSLSKIQAEEQGDQHKDSMTVGASIILKKKRTTEQPVTAEESTYESTVKSVLANLRSELSGLTSLRKTRNSDLAGELLEILAKQLLDHGREKSELADQVRAARERFSRNLSIDESRRAQEYQQSQDNLREQLQQLMQRIEESDKHFLNRLEENHISQRDFRSQLQAKFQDKLTQEAIEQAQFTAEMQSQFEALSQLHKQTITALTNNPPGISQKSNNSCSYNNKHTPEKQTHPITSSTTKHPSDEDPTQSSSFFLSELLAQKENSYPYSEPSKPPVAASGQSKLQLLQPRILFSQQKANNIQSYNSNNTIRKSIATKINRSLKMSSSLLEITDTPIQISSMTNKNDLDHISTSSQKDICIVPQSRYSVNSYHSQGKQRYCVSSSGNYSSNNNEENHNNNNSMITQTNRQQIGLIQGQKRQQLQQKMATIDGVICTEEHRSPNRYQSYLSEGMFSSLSVNNNDIRSSISTVKQSKKLTSRAQSLLNPIVVSKNQSDLRQSSGITTVNTIIPMQTPNLPITIRRQSHSMNKPISTTITTEKDKISFPNQIPSFQQQQQQISNNNGRKSMRLSQLALVSAETITTGNKLQLPVNIRSSRIMSSS